MAFIYQRKAQGGMWYVRYKRLGKWSSRSLKTKDGRMAKSELRAIERRLAKESLSIVSPGRGFKVSELCDLYEAHAQNYYVTEDGNCTKEVASIRESLVLLRVHCGELLADTFGPLALKEVREQMIRKTYGTKRKTWSRKTVNDRVQRIKRCFKWAAENELIAASVYHGVQAVAGLRMGRSAARETAPVTPVDVRHIAPVQEAVSRQVAALIDLQLLSAARPGELVALRGCDIDTSGELWLAKLKKHKTAHHGRERILYFGPKAQAVLRPFLRGRAATSPLFSPLEAELERIEERHKHRVTPLHYGNRPGTNRSENPECRPGCHYTVASYRKAVRRACERAGMNVWSPNQLRHNAATRVRKEFGLHAAQVILGHASADVTQVYAEVNQTLALDVLRKIG